MLYERLSTGTQETRMSTKRSKPAKRELTPFEEANRDAVGRLHAQLEENRALASANNALKTQLDAATKENSSLRDAKAKADADVRRLKRVVRGIFDALAACIEEAEEKGSPFG